MSIRPAARGEPESELTLDEALVELARARRTVERVRDHNDILTVQVMRLVEENGVYRRQLQTAARTLLDGTATLAVLGEDCLRASKLRVGVPSGAPETKAAVAPPPD